MAVIRRDIDREKAKLALQEAESKPKSIEPIEISSDEEDDSKRKALQKGKGKLKSGFGTVDDDGVIHIDSDSDTDDSDIVEIMGPPGPRAANSAPQGISLSTFQASPSGGGIGDLQSAPHSPSGGPSSPKKRGSVSLRLDLSSEALRGIPAFGTDGPSPVTLAPRTGRLLSAHPSMVTGGPSGPLDPFFVDLASSQAASIAQGGGGLLPVDLLSAITAQSQAQHDLIGSMPGTGVGQNLLDLPPMDLNANSNINDLAMNASEISHQMALDLFGDDDDDDEALVNSQLQGHDFNLDTSKLTPDNGTVVNSQELDRLLAAHQNQITDGGAGMGGDGSGMLGMLMGAAQSGDQQPAGDTVLVQPPGEATAVNLDSESNQPQASTSAGAPISSAPPAANTDSGPPPSKSPQPNSNPVSDDMVVDQIQTSTSAAGANLTNPDANAQSNAAAAEAAKSNSAPVAGFTPYNLAELGDMDMGLDNFNMDDMGMGSIDFSSLLSGNPSGSGGAGGGLNMDGLGMDFGGGAGLGGMGDGFNLNLEDMDFSMFSNLGGGGASGSGQ